MHGLTKRSLRHGALFRFHLERISWIHTYKGDLANVLRFKSISPCTKTLEPHDFVGQSVLVVNSASQCSYASQLNQLNTLHERFQERGFNVISIPSNDFDQKEPTMTNQELQTTYTNLVSPSRLTLTLTTKEHVIGENAHPFFAQIAKIYGRSVAPTWNYDKFLIDRYGDLSAVFPHDTEPLDQHVIEAIELVLSEVYSFASDDEYDSDEDEDCEEETTTRNNNKH